MVVSNTGPIVAPAKADYLSLLPIFYGEVLIPPAVHRELLAKIGPEAQRIDDGLNRRAAQVLRDRGAEPMSARGVGRASRDALAHRTCGNPV
jgi:predicted nucleic acid-binding protein